MSEYRVASRYAKSLLSLALERGVLEEVHDDLQLFRKVCDENRDFVVMLKNPIISHDRKTVILNKLFESKFQHETMAFLGIIAQKHREMLLPAIADEFHKQYNDHHGIGMANVTTVFQLDDRLRQEFKTLTGGLIGKRKIELSESIDKDLIGGYVLKVEGKQVDESLRGKLKELSLKFS
jgi:F-type H+-transporting ATPase subunit delta